MNATYCEENRRQRERLMQMSERLTDGDLARRIGNGWTVSETLVHLAFWDRRQHALLRAWIDDGVRPAAGDWESTNGALEFVAREVLGRRAVELAKAAAVAVDEAVEAVLPAMAEQIQAAGQERLLMRFLHRRHHLDRIEEALRGAR